MSAVPGTSIQESMRLGRYVSKELLANPQIASVAQQVGRAEKADDTWGVNYSEMHVDLKPFNGEGAGEVEGEMRKAVGKFPGVYFAIHAFLAERIEEIISGTIGEVVIKVFGDDLDQVDRASRDVARVVEGVRGAADVQLESQASAPRIVVRPRPERLKQFGFRPMDVLDAVETAYQGSVAAQTYEASRVVEVAVILEDSARHFAYGS
jgi:Cu/Ag efflux pump CusA